MTVTSPTSSFHINACSSVTSCSSISTMNNDDDSSVGTRRSSNSSFSNSRPNFEASTLASSARRSTRYISANVTTSRACSNRWETEISSRIRQRSNKVPPKRCLRRNNSRDGNDCDTNHLQFHRRSTVPTLNISKDWESNGLSCPLPSSSPQNRWHAPSCSESSPGCRMPKRQLTIPRKSKI